MSVKTTEQEIATKLISCSSNEWLQWLETVSAIEWTTLGEEPDVIKAIVFGQVLTNDPTAQEVGLALLLSKKNDILLKPLLSKRAVIKLLQMCVNRFNEINAAKNRSAQLVERTNENPQIVITTVQTFNANEFLQRS